MTASGLGFARSGLRTSDSDLRNDDVKFVLGQEAGAPMETRIDTPSFRALRGTRLSVPGSTRNAALPESTSDPSRSRLQLTAPCRAPSLSRRTMRSVGMKPRWTDPHRP
jgi:hypothetical protein